jgi:hypothetical protein
MSLSCRLSWPARCLGDHGRVRTTSHLRMTRMEVRRQVALRIRTLIGDDGLVVTRGYTSAAIRAIESRQVWTVDVATTESGGVVPAETEVCAGVYKERPFRRLSISALVGDSQHGGRISSCKALFKIQSPTLHGTRRVTVPQLSCRDWEPFSLQVGEVADTYTPKHWL